MTLLADGAVRPDISVITVVLNGASHLEQCLQSVRMQRNIRYEHIVIDGGSSDGSIDIIKRCADSISAWLSEPDDGIGDAMNKGIKRAKGEWLLFLHADDYLLSSNILAECCRTARERSADIVGFPVRFGAEGGGRVMYPRGNSWWMNFKTGWLHQATLIHRTVPSKIGAYDASFKVAVDYEFFLRAKRGGISMANERCPIPTHMRNTGISSRRDKESLRRRLLEERRVHSMHSPSSLYDVLYCMYWKCYLAYRRVRA